MTLTWLIRVRLNNLLDTVDCHQKEVRKSKNHACYAGNQAKNVLRL